MRGSAHPYPSPCTTTTTKQKLVLVAFNSDRGRASTTQKIASFNAISKSDDCEICKGIELTDSARFAHREMTERQQQDC